MAGAIFAMALLVGAGRWLAALDCAIPDAAVAGNAGWGADARLVVYVLTWVSRALRGAPSRLFDAPVGYPAPDALTGSEYFLGAQLAFMPLHLGTGNVVLAANMTALVSYWLAAMLMFVVLRRFGLGFASAVAGGFANAFGPLQVPADLHQLQFPSWGLPLVLLAAARVWAHPTRAVVAAFGGALVVTTLTSYSLAANAFALVAVLIVAARSAPPRGRAAHRLGLCRGGAGAAAVVLLLVSLPYVARLGESPERAFAAANAESALFGAHFMAEQVDAWLVLVALVGLAAAWRAGARRRPSSWARFWRSSAPCSRSARTARSPASTRRCRTRSSHGSRAAAPSTRRVSSC